MKKASDKKSEDKWRFFSGTENFRNFGFLIIAGVTLFSIQFDEIRIGEYWTLLIVCIACLIYIYKNANDDRVDFFVNILTLAAVIVAFLIWYRQNLRFDDYDISWDIAYSNTLTDNGLPAVQVGLCVVNPNNFPVFVKISSISANIEKVSGSYPNEFPDRILEVGRGSSNGIQFSDPIQIDVTGSENKSGILHATVNYGREVDRIDKQMRVLANVKYLTDGSGNVVGTMMDPTTGTVPNKYSLMRKARKSDCETF